MQLLKWTCFTMSWRTSHSSSIILNINSSYLPVIISISCAMIYRKIQVAIECRDNFSSATTEAFSITHCLQTLLWSLVGAASVRTPTIWTFPAFPLVQSPLSGFWLVQTVLVLVPTFWPRYCSIHSHKQHVYTDLFNLIYDQ